MINELSEVWNLPHPGHGPHSEKTCRFNRSMQHHLPSWAKDTSHRESICTALFNQNLSRAFVLFELTQANEISILDSYKKTFSMCCNDLLRPPDFPGLGAKSLGTIWRIGWMACICETARACMYCQPTNHRKQRYKQVSWFRWRGFQNSSKSKTLSGDLKNKPIRTV